MDEETPHRKLNPYERPPEHIREIFKRYQKVKPSYMDQDDILIDFDNINHHGSSIRQVGLLSKEIILRACNAIENGDDNSETAESLLLNIRERPIFEHSNLPGKYWSHKKL